MLWRHLSACSQLDMWQKSTRLKKMPEKEMPVFNEGSSMVKSNWLSTRMRLFINAPCLCLDYWWLIFGFISMSREESRLSLISIRATWDSSATPWKCLRLRLSPYIVHQQIPCMFSSPDVVGRFPLDVSGFHLGDLYVFSCQKTLGRRKGGCRNL